MNTTESPFLCHKCKTNNNTWTTTTANNTQTVKITCMTKRTVIQHGTKIHKFTK